MTSQVAICNNALVRLRASTIISLTDNTYESNLCSIVYNVSAARAMYMYNWSSCITRAALAQSSTDPEFGYSYQYRLPVNPECLRVLTINDLVPGIEEFKIEGQFLLTDASSVNLKYIGFLTNTSEYGSALTEAVILSLIKDLAYPLTGNKDLAAAADEDLRVYVTRMAALDGQQSTPDYTYPDTFIEVR